MSASEAVARATAGAFVQSVQDEKPKDPAALLSAFDAFCADVNGTLQPTIRQFASETLAKDTDTAWMAGVLVCAPADAPSIHTTLSEIRASHDKMEDPKAKGIFVNTAHDGKAIDLAQAAKLLEAGEAVEFRPVRYERMGTAATIGWALLGGHCSVNGYSCSSFHALEPTTVSNAAELARFWANTQLL